MLTRKHPQLMKILVWYNGRRALQEREVGPLFGAIQSPQGTKPGCLEGTQNCCLRSQGRARNVKSFTEGHPLEVHQRGGRHGDRKREMCGIGCA